VSTLARGHHAELDGLAEEFISEQGGYPTFKGYRGYPAATCISPNAMIVHGIPARTSSRTATSSRSTWAFTLDGFVADSAYTFAIGEYLPTRERLLDVARPR
jgi:methionyl aminopeptidase